MGRWRDTEGFFVVRVGCYFHAEPANFGQSLFAQDHRVFDAKTSLPLGSDIEADHAASQGFRPRNIFDVVFRLVSGLVNWSRSTRRHYCLRARMCLGDVAYADGLTRHAREGCRQFDTRKSCIEFCSGAKPYRRAQVLTIFASMFSLLKVGKSAAVARLCLAWG